MNDPNKHIRYQDYYKSNDYFWGIGIENETYFQFTNPREMTVKEIYRNHKPERYSVNYFAGLNPEYKNLIKLIYPISKSAVILSYLSDTDVENNQIYDIPLYLNSHTLQKTDKNGSHATTYEKIPKPNEAFLGKTVHDLLVEENPTIFGEKYKVNYIYDGDTIEFMTQNFYKTTVKQNIDELIREKTIYINALNEAFRKLNIFQNYGKVIYPKKNEPFVCFLTNQNNIAIFNNGTYHLNFTMPTQLDSTKKPLNPKLFVDQHRAAIRYIQYLEPLIIAIYGTPDPFSSVSTKYSKASQRCAVSRYIGIGTYNTEEMQTGKILSIETNECLAVNKPYWWYTQYTKDSHYKPLTKIGVDINFNKHGTHGIEIRFLDWFPEEMLEEIMTCMVHTLDYSLKYGLPDDPTICPIWNGLVTKMLKNGICTTLSEEEYEMYNKVFRLSETSILQYLQFFNKSNKSEKTIQNVYANITKSLKKTIGPCRRFMLGEPAGCFEKIKSNPK